MITALRDSFVALAFAAASSVLLIILRHCIEAHPGLFTHAMCDNQSGGRGEMLRQAGGIDASS